MRREIVTVFSPRLRVVLARPCAKLREQMDRQRIPMKKKKNRCLVVVVVVVLFVVVSISFRF